MIHRHLFAAALASIATLSANSEAFTHIVQDGDTLASISERYYGHLQHEKLLVAANGLNDQGGSPIVPGMRLEIPAVTHRRVEPGDTWNNLAERLLGSSQRSDVFARANDSNAWLPPGEGALIRVPYNLKVLAAGDDSIVTIAYRYLGNTEKAWVLDHYNGLKGRQLQRGDVVLIPLTDLQLTAQGREAAEQAAKATSTQSEAPERQAQQGVERELPALIADVRGGRYVDAVTRGTRFLSSVDLSVAQLATVHRQLLEAYVALDAPGLATTSCTEWLKRDRQARLDPIRLSPKLIAACERGMP